MNFQDHYFNEELNEAVSKTLGQVDWRERKVWHTTPSGRRTKVKIKSLDADEQAKYNPDRVSASIPKTKTGKVDKKKLPKTKEYIKKKKEQQKTIVVTTKNIGYWIKVGANWHQVDDVVAGIIYSGDKEYKNKQVTDLKRRKPSKKKATPKKSAPKKKKKAKK